MTDLGGATQAPFISLLSLEEPSGTKRRRGKTIIMDSIASRTKRKRNNDQTKRKKENKRPKKCSSIFNRCSPKPLSKAVSHLKPKQRAAAEAMGFGKLLSLKVDGIPQKLGYYVVDMFNDDDMEISLPNGKIKVDEEAVYTLLGIPNHGIDLLTVPDPEMRSGKVYKWRRLYGDGYISPAEILARITALPDDDNDYFKLDFLALFLSTMVECQAHGKCKLAAIYKLNNGYDISQVNWCSYVVSKLKTCKLLWDRTNKTPFTGPLTILTLLYVRATKCRGITVDYCKPTIETWNLEKLKLRQKIEIKNGGFGMCDFIGMCEESLVNEKEKDDEVTNDQMVHDHEQFKASEIPGKENEKEANATKHHVSHNEQQVCVSILEERMTKAMKYKTELELGLTDLLEKTPESYVVKNLLSKFECVFKDKLTTGWGPMHSMQQEKNEDCVNPVDDLIYGVCMEMNQHRQTLIESEDDSDESGQITLRRDNNKGDIMRTATELNETNKDPSTNTVVEPNDNMVDNKFGNYKQDELGSKADCPVFSLGLTQEVQEGFVIGRGRGSKPIADGVSGKDGSTTAGEKGFVVVGTEKSNTTDEEGIRLMGNEHLSVLRAAQKFAELVPTRSDTDKRISALLENPVVERSFHPDRTISEASFNTQFSESNMSSGIQKSSSHFALSDIDNLIYRGAIVKKEHLNPVPLKPRAPMLCSKSSASKKRETTNVIDLQLFEDMDPQAITKKVQSVVRLGLEKLSSSLEAMEKKAEKAEEMIEDMKQLVAVKSKAMEKYVMEIACLKEELQDVKAKHKQEMQGMIEEAKRSAAITVLQSRIKMAKEAVAEGFDAATWDIRGWCIALANLGGEVTSKDTGMLGVGDGDGKEKVVQCDEGIDA